MEMKTFLLLLLCFQLSICKSLLDDVCGDWAPYKDEKCLKIFDKNLVSYTEAENFCKNEDGGVLSSIINEEEQQFMENLLKSQNVVDNVWIGLKYVNKSYVWPDGTEAKYIHWASGSPSNDSDYCVEIATEKNSFGYWIDEACSKKNLVSCEKLQLWSQSKLQTMVMKMELLLTNLQSMLVNDESTLTNVQQELEDVKSTLMDVIPVGFIYVQLPNEKPPKEVWPEMKWKWNDVSSDYAGLFFRAEGGNSAEFGVIQNETSPRLVSVFKGNYDLNEDNNYDGIVISYDGGFSVPILTGGAATFGSDNNIGIAFQTLGAEVCPRNTAIRIWRRIS